MANRSRAAFSCRRRSFSTVSSDGSAETGRSAWRIKVRSFSSASAVFICWERVSSLLITRYPSLVIRPLCCKVVKVLNEAQMDSFRCTNPHLPAGLTDCACFPAARWLFPSEIADPPLCLRCSHFVLPGHCYGCTRWLAFPAECIR